MYNHKVHYEIETKFSFILRIVNSQFAIEWSDITQYNQNDNVSMQKLNEQIASRPLNRWNVNAII